MFIGLPTTKKEYAINLDKVLFFYKQKDTVTRIEMEDGTIMDFNVSYDDIMQLLKNEGVAISHARLT